MVFFLYNFLYFPSGSQNLTLRSYHIFLSHSCSYLFLNIVEPVIVLNAEDNCYRWTLSNYRSIIVHFLIIHFSLHDIYIYSTFPTNNQ